MKAIKFDSGYALASAVVAVYSIGSKTWMSIQGKVEGGNDGVSCDVCCSDKSVADVVKELGWEIQ